MSVGETTSRPLFLSSHFKQNIPGPIGRSHNKILAYELLLGFIVYIYNTLFQNTKHSYKQVQLLRKRKPRVQPYQGSPKKNKQICK